MSGDSWPHINKTCQVMPSDKISIIYKLGILALGFVLCTACTVSLSDICLGQTSQGDVTLANDANLDLLKSYILRDKSVEAEAFVRQFPDESESVLQGVVASENADVRRVAVELAGINPSLTNCRLLLDRLADPDSEVQDLALFQIRGCHHPELVPEMLEIMQGQRLPDFQSALALLIGRLGGEAEIKPLTKFRKKNVSDPDVDHDFSIALARLGDPEARGELIQRLNSHTDPEDRVLALNDCVYVADISLVSHFGPAVNDHREVVALSIPENPPIEYARVADIAVYVMVQLGVELSFSLEGLERLEFTQLEEANRYIQTM